MAHSRLAYLASQAETEGITLGELLARDMNTEEMEDVQAELVAEIAEGYRNISGFMQYVDVPSLTELMESTPGYVLGLPWDVGPEPSDAA